MKCSEKEITQNDYYKKFTHLIKSYKPKQSTKAIEKYSNDEENDDKTEDNHEDEADLRISNIYNIPVDPFTNQPVKDAVKNKKCGHIYDREGIKTYISISKKPR